MAEPVVIAPAVTPEAGQAGKTEGDAHSQEFQVPDKLKGKSSEELAKSYLELEKKLGEQSKEVGDARKKVDDALTLQKAANDDRKLLSELTELIYSDPERVKTLESWYASKSGQSDNQQSNGQQSKPGNSQPSSQPSQEVLDTRRAMQDQIFDDFYAKHGIDKLPSKEKQEALQRVSSEFADLFDSTGKKTVSQIVNERSLSSLRRDLDKAYKLSGLSEDENMQGALAQVQNDQAAIGGLQGHAVREDQIKLNAAEEDMAKKLGITPEKYLQRKKEIAKETGSVS